MDNSAEASAIHSIGIVAARDIDLTQSDVNKAAIAAGRHYIGCSTTGARCTHRSAPASGRRSACR